MNDIICIVESDKYKYFKEYLLSLGFQIRFYPCKINKGEKILVVQKLLDLNYENSSYIGLLNTEQLTKEEWNNYYFNYVFQTKINLQLFDYSKSNIKYLRKKYGIVSQHLPYKYRDEEISFLKNLITNTPKIYDVAFIGATNGRREEIINKLKENNISVNIIVDKWDNERDEEVAKCKILLNLHFSDEFKIFEEIRCNRWLMADFKVVTENSVNENEISHKSNLIIIKTEKIVETVSAFFRLEIEPKIIEQALPRIFIFWTDRNVLTENRKNSIENIKAKTGVSVILITVDNLSDWILKDYPIHPAYEFLSSVHKADYLRCYFMHHYGGGYSDIKLQTDSWVNSFKKLNNSGYSVCLGYQEVNGGVANIKNRKLYEEMNNEYHKLIGNGAYIFKPRNFFTLEWYNQLHEILNNKYEELKLNPASNTRDHKGFFLGDRYSNYPLEWTEILGNIFHPLCYKYNCFVLQGLPTPIFNSYL